MNDAKFADAALDVFPEPLAIVDFRHEVKKTNAAWQRVLGAPEGLLGVEPLKSALVQVLSGASARVDVSVRAASATYAISVVRMEVESSPAALLHARQGAPSAEEQADASLLRRAMHVLPVLVGITGFHGRNLFINDTGARFFGRSREELEGKSYYEFLPASDAAIAREVEARVLATGTEEIITADIESAAGPRSVFFHFIPIEGRNPSERLLVFVGQDVTEQLSAERDLREQQEFMRQVIDGDPNLIFVKDERGSFLLVNKATADVFGKTVDEMVGQNDRYVTPEKAAADGYLENDRRVLATLSELTVEEQVRWATGEARWYQTTKRPLFRSNGEVQLLGCAVDITARLEAQKQLEAAAHEVELRAAEAFRQAEAKEALVHELDQKLGIIENQHQEILSLSAPLLDVGENILAVPIVGAMSDARTVEIMTRLLEAIVERQVEHVVLDLTGLESIETNTADQLMGIVKAIQLLGADAIISGIRPAVAQTIVELGIDLSSLKTHRTMRSAILWNETQRYLREVKRKRASKGA